MKQGQIMCFKNHFALSVDMREAQEQVQGDQLGDFRCSSRKERIMVCNRVLAVGMERNEDASVF